MITDPEIEELALEHEESGFGQVGADGLTFHSFDPNGLKGFVRAVELKVATRQSTLDKFIPVAYRFTHNWNPKSPTFPATGQYTYHDHTKGNHWQSAYKDTCLKMEGLYTADMLKQVVSERDLSNELLLSIAIGVASMLDLNTDEDPIGTVFKELTNLTAAKIKLLAAQNINGPDTIRNETIAFVAKYLDKKADNYAHEFGIQDPETGSLEFGHGKHAEAKDDYFNNLKELSEEVAKLGGAVIKAARDKDLDQVITQRDNAEDMADRLADMIAKITEVNIGEHSSANCPWQNALDAASSLLQDLDPAQPDMEKPDGKS